MDAQLPPALARWLSTKGHDAQHVADCGLLSAGDRAIWDYAVAHAAVILTKDEDFAIRRALEQGPPPIVWLRMGNTRRAELLRRMERLLPAFIGAIEQGDTLVEVN